MWCISPKGITNNEERGVGIMFDVIDKKSDQIDNAVTVFDVSYDKNGYPLFLIYEDNQWKRVSAKRFREITYEDCL